MAGLLALLRGLRKSETECRILLLGLDNAGKTSCLKKLADEKKDANAIRCVCVRVVWTAGDASSTDFHAASTQCFTHHSRALSVPPTPPLEAQPHHAHAGLQHQVAVARQFQAQRVGHWRAKGDSPMYARTHVALVSDGAVFIHPCRKKTQCLLSVSVSLCSFPLAPSRSAATPQTGATITTTRTRSSG